MNFPSDFKWQPNWKILVFVGLFLPLTISLGFWQLDRAAQKKEILQAQSMQQELEPISNGEWQEDRANHLRRVVLQMNLDPDKYLLLANRLMDGQVGYEVISLGYLSTQGGTPILINRGWVEASLDRSQLPEIKTPVGLQLVTGYYYCPEANSMIRQSAEFDGNWPAILYAVDTSAMQVVFNASERPLACEVRIDPSSPLSFKVRWEVVNQTEAKHIGYAVQWFLMAFALIILALFSNSNLGAFFRRGTNYQ